MQKIDEARVVNYRVIYQSSLFNNFDDGGQLDTMRSQKIAQVNGTNTSSTAKANLHD